MRARYIIPSRTPGSPAGDGPERATPVTDAVTVVLYRVWCTVVVYPGCVQAGYPGLVYREATRAWCTAGRPDGQ